MHVTQAHWVSVLKPRGIDQEIITPDRYLSYEPGDLEKLRQLVSLGKGGKRAFRTRTILSGPGLLIQRYGFSQKPSLRRSWWPPSQLRPDQPRSKDERYIFTEGYAQGIDFHPRVDRDWLRKYGHLSVSFFCLEGALKADAALSWGLQAFNVASVTLWDSQNLRQVEHILKRSPIVFVVTDSDWDSNDDVWNQAVRCVTKLRELGVPAVHVAPSALPGLEKTGLDDAIGSGRWDPVDGMLVIPRMPEDAPPAASASAKAVYRWFLSRKRRHIDAYTGEISNTLGLSKRTVQRAVVELERMGKLKIEPGKRYLESGYWTANPNSYVLAVPEVLTLAELGWGGWGGTAQLQVTDPAWGRRDRRHLMATARKTLEASTPSVVPLGCELCGKPLQRVLATNRFCSSQCRLKRWRAGQNTRAAGTI